MIGFWMIIDRIEGSWMAATLFFSVETCNANCSKPPHGSIHNDTSAPHAWYKPSAHKRPATYLNIEIWASNQ